MHTHPTLLEMSVADRHARIRADRQILGRPRPNSSPPHTSRPPRGRRVTIAVRIGWLARRLRLPRLGRTIGAHGVVARAAVAVVAFGAIGVLAACDPVPTCQGRAATIVGTAGPDTIHGTIGPDVIVGLGGDDNIHGIEGADVICGGAGNDFIAGWNGADILDGEAGNDVLEGEYGADRLLDTGTSAQETNLLRPGPSDDVVVGGAGRDLVDYSDTFQFVIVDLAAGTSTNGSGTDTLQQIDGVRGSWDGDIISGNAGANVLDGGEGGDILIGRGGDDTYVGGPGEDQISFAGATAAVRADLVNGRASGEGADVLSGIEHLEGGRFGDTLIGDHTPNRLDGGAGTDTCEGSGGFDTYISCP